MQFFKYFLITIVILALLDPTEGGWIRGAVKKVVKFVKKVGCKVLYAVGCPLAVGSVGTAIGAGTSGLGNAVVAGGVKAGIAACHVRSSKCKRSVEMTEILIPFSDEMSDYDMNKDKLVTYEEFVFASLLSVNLADPEELREPFVLADFDGNGVLDTDEFNGAPFLFADASWNHQNVSVAA